MTTISRPRSMAELGKMMQNAALELDLMRTDLHRATLETPRDASIAATRAVGVDKLGTRHRASDATESALSAAEQALQEAAEAMVTVYTEMKRAGVPENATW